MYIIQDTCDFQINYIKPEFLIVGFVFRRWSMQEQNHSQPSMWMVKRMVKNGRSRLKLRWKRWQRCGKQTQEKQKRTLLERLEFRYDRHFIELMFVNSQSSLNFFSQWCLQWGKYLHNQKPCNVYKGIVTLTEMDILNFWRTSLTLFAHGTICAWCFIAINLWQQSDKTCSLNFALLTLYNVWIINKFSLCVM